MRIDGLNDVTAAINKLARAGADVHGKAVIVGFTANYGLYVHENMEARHTNGQAKFLEQPARAYGKEIGRIIADAYRRTRDMLQSLLLGGLFLQREAQLLCPVDTGNLSGSAFTREAT